jgi:lysyl-tRNA synthetase class 1
MDEEKKLIYLKQQEDWMGAMVICEKCNRTQEKQKDGTVKPNRVLKYYPETDECDYLCPACGFSGKISIKSGLIKLNWRLDWPAKWTIFNTTCEPAGKDHCTPGGSYDTGLELCREVYGYQGPIKVAYEWLRLGDRDMKTSKGIVFTPEKFLTIADPEIIRMLIYQTNPNKHLSLRIEEMEQYCNEFQRIERIFFDLEDASDEEKREIKFIYPLICSKQVPREIPIQIPFKLLSVLAQLKPILLQEGIYQKAQNYLKNEGIKTKLDADIFSKKIEIAQSWISLIKVTLANERDPGIKKKLQGKIILFSILTTLTSEIREKLSDIQKTALKSFLKEIKDIEELNNENVRDIMIKIREKLQISASKIFQAFYLVLMGKKKGPRLGPIMEMLDKQWIENRLQEAII